MDFLLRFGEKTYMIVKAINKCQAQNFMKTNYMLSAEEYGITEADSYDVKFVKNKGGKILLADPSIPYTIYKEG